MTEIRRALPKDAPQLAYLGRAGFPGYPFIGIYDEDYLATAILEGELRWVATDADRIIATAVLGEGHMAEIKRVVVHPDYRGNGAAKLLTRHLSNEAKAIGVNAWTDARSDQPGMQSSATSSGLTAVSLESGKHVVYDHAHPTGPARETMVHMTSLDIDYLSARKSINELEVQIPGFKNNLLDTMSDSFTPQPKDPKKANLLLASAQRVRSSVNDALSSMYPQTIFDQKDVSVINLSGCQMIVIAPDKSAFLTHPEDSIGLDQAAKLVDQLELQILTSYLPLQDQESVSRLYSAGFRPVMIRPWTSSPGNSPSWQVGMRLTANHYISCLHTISLTEVVQSQIKDTITSLQ